MGQVAKEFENNYKINFYGEENIRGILKKAELPAN